MEAARSIYGVELDKVTRNVDLAATKELRKAIRESEIKGLK